VTSTDRICAWLIEQGYTSGWVLTGDKITLWLNDDPQPEIPAELLDPAPELLPELAPEPLPEPETEIELETELEPEPAPEPPAELGRPT
jgi:hypothetical protein